MTALLERPTATDAAGGRLFPQDGVHVAVAALLVLAVAFVIGLLGDPRVSSGSDVGGKLATVRVMAEGDTWSPDVGYWAEAEDPEGDLHQLLKTQLTDEGWIQVTGLPLILPAVPLWDLGGPGMLLLLTVGSAPLAALAARRLARQLGAASGWGAFWLVGLGSPVLVYSADFWEHAPSVAAGLWAISLAHGLPDVTGRVRPWVMAVLAGSVAALGVLLRPEVALTLVFVGLALLVTASERRRLLAAWMRLALAGSVAAVGFLVWSRIESRILGSAVRSSRASGQLSDVGSQLGTRARDAALTGFGLWSDDRPLFLLVGLGVVGLLVFAVRRDHEGTSVSPLLAVGAPIVYVARMTVGLGFVPGALPASPGAIGAVGARSPRERALAGGATVAVIATWALQWKGGMLAQWGGRYLLVPTAVLTVVGAVALERSGWRRPGAIAVVACTVLVSTFGATWHVVRSNGVAAAIEAVENVPADVVIVATGIDSGRTAGAWYGDHRWLTARSGDLAEVVAIAAAHGASRVDVVYPEPLDGPRPIDGAEEGERRSIDVVNGLSFTVVSYHPTAAG